MFGIHVFRLFSFSVTISGSSIISHLLPAVAFFGHVEALDGADLLSAEGPDLLQAVSVLIQVHQGRLVRTRAVLIRVPTEDSDAVLLFGGAGVYKLLVVDSSPLEVGELNDFQDEDHEGEEHVIDGHYHQLVAPGNEHQHVRVHKEDRARLEQEVDHCRNEEGLNDCRIRRLKRHIHVGLVREEPRVHNSHRLERVAHHHPAEVFIFFLVVVCPVSKRCIAFSLSQVKEEAEAQIREQHHKQASQMHCLDQHVIEGY